ncbi:MAG TPA: GldM family protein, partial [Chitinophagaceae bacterium]
MGFNGSGFPDYLEDVSHSPLFTPKMREYMKRCQPGSRVYIDHIRAKGPDGVERNLEGAIIFNLN